MQGACPLPIIVGHSRIIIIVRHYESINTMLIHYPQYIIIII